jgi:hypothetical protein
MRKIILAISILCLALIISGCAPGGQAIAGQPSYEQLLYENQQLRVEMEQRSRDCDQKIEQMQEECERQLKGEETKKEEDKLATRAFYQCTELTKDNPNTFVTTDPKRCGTQEFLGYLFVNADARPGLVPIFDCAQEDSRYERFGWTGKRYYYYDSFLSLDPNCENKIKKSLAGYGEEYAKPGVTIEIYRRWMGGIPEFNHILSTNPEGAEVTFHFLKNPRGVPSKEPVKLTEQEVMDALSALKQDWDTIYTKLQIGLDSVKVLLSQNIGTEEVRRQVLDKIANLKSDLQKMDEDQTQKFDQLKDTLKESEGEKLESIKQDIDQNQEILTSFQTEFMSKVNQLKNMLKE